MGTAPRAPPGAPGRGGFFFLYSPRPPPFCGPPMPPRRPAVSHKVQTTVTQAPVVYRQERQLIAGRYRLVSFHRGDNSTEVWRALDESTTQIVSLEFLRDPDPASKEPFLAGARRLASVAPPTVMKVASIHDDADGTFIVFEHLVQIPVPLE